MTEHITDGTPCWCNPEMTYKDPINGTEVFVHKEMQMNKTTEALKHSDSCYNALRLAEESLGNLIRWMDANKFVVLPKERENLAAIREALAEQDKQEPVKACVSGVCPNKAKCDAAQFCLYTEAEPVKQEPVASVVAMLDKCISIIGTEMVRCKQADDKWFMCQRFIHAIQDMQYEFKRDYAAPVSAKREWVDLTDDELRELIRKEHDAYCLVNAHTLKFARAVIAAFKEKNK